MNAATTFIDVPINHWAAEQIYQFTDNGIINGRQDGTYGPNDNITRAQAARILTGTLQLEVGASTDIDYKDVGQDHYAFKAIKAMKKANIMNGTNGYFRPRHVDPCPYVDYFSQSV